MSQEVSYTVLHDAEEDGTASDEEPEGQDTHLTRSPRSSVDTRIADIEDFTEDDPHADTPGNALISDSTKRTYLSGSPISRFAWKVSKSATEKVIKGVQMVRNPATWQRIGATLSDTAYYTGAVLRVSPSNDVRIAWIDSCLPADLTLFDPTERPYSAPLANQAIRGLVAMPRSVAYGACCACLDCSGCGCCYELCKEAKDVGRAMFLPERYGPNTSQESNVFALTSRQRREEEAMRSSGLTPRTAEAHGYSSLPATMEYGPASPSEQTTNVDDTESNDAG